MAIFTWIIFYIALGSLVAVGLYVLATYLLLSYDRRLARFGKVTPPYDDPTTFPRGWRRWRSLTWEILSVFAVVWLFPFGKLTRRNKLSARGGGLRPILLVHGYNHNKSGWTTIGHKLARAGFGPVYSFNLPARKHCLKGFAEAVGVEAERIEKETGCNELILIGHSMGGVVSAMYAEKLAPPGKVTHVITLGSPLHGTRMAFMGSRWAAAHLSCESALLKETRRSIAANHTVRYHHLASIFDNMILPYQSALIGKSPGCESLLPDLGHMTLLFSRRVTAQVVEWLRSTVPLATETPQPVAEEAQAVQNVHAR